MIVPENDSFKSDRFHKWKKLSFLNENDPVWNENDIFLIKKTVLE